MFGALGIQSRFGTLSQFLIVSEEGCALLPEGVDIDQAAAVGTAGLTAYQSFPRDIVKPGSKVFINGGSGGTGTFGIQFAKALGAHVMVSCSGRNAQLCRSLGADEVIDYTTADILSELKKLGQVFDLAVDNAGTPASLYQSSDVFLKPDGAFMQVGVTAPLAGMGTVLSRAMRPAFLGGGRRIFTFVKVSSSRKDFEQIGRWIADGKVKSVIDQKFEWEDTPKAYEKLRLGRTQGKIIVHVGQR